MNRVKVRCYGYHDKTLSKEDLPWATVIMPTTSPSLKGVGANHHLEVGSWVVGFFRDGLSAQDPMVMGSVATQEDGIKDIPTEAEANYPNNKVYKSNAGHLIEIDNTKVESILDVSKLIAMSTSEFIDFKVSRYDQEIILKVKPNFVDSVDELGNKLKKRMVGIKLSPYNNQITHKKLGPAQALLQSFNEVYFVTTSSLKYLGSMFTGAGDSSQLGGPIRIAKISGQVAEFGIVPFISMMAYISISLGLINLFPIPLLDGGHLMFYAFEKVLGRPLSQKTQEGFFRIGMFLLLSLMFFATFNDLKDLGLF